MSYIGNIPTNVAFLTDTFSGNASTTAFTMSVAPANTSSMLVAITGVVQDPSTYSVAGTTLTFSAAPPTGTNNISVRYLGIPASGVTTTAYRTITNFTATAGQTSFTVPSYTVGYIDVYRNGVRLTSADFTASTGTTVVLANAANAGDSVVTESFYVSSVLNAIPATSGSVSNSYLVDGAVTTSKITDASVTQAKLGANVAGNGPAFSAYMGSSQSVSGSVSTLLQFTGEEFDTNSCFNNTGSTVGGIPAYAFKPNVAGFYLVTGSVYSSTTTSGVQSQIYKNGVMVKRFYVSSVNGMAAVTALIQFDGANDYIQLYGLADGTTPTINNNGGLTFFQASMVRAA